MVYKIDKKNYQNVLPLIQSHNELSVFAVLNRKMTGTVYGNDSEKPTTVLIRTSECNLIAGESANINFLMELRKKLDFWDTMTPDSEEWENVIPMFHPDRFIRKYTRRRYVYTIEEGPREYDEKHKKSQLPEGFILEQADPKVLRESKYKNADELIEWIENWGCDDNFIKFGAGVYLRNEDTIVSWSISDCSDCCSIAIGIHTDDGYRKRGFATIVGDRMIQLCKQKGYHTIEWLCVDINQGSYKTAEKIGFKLQNKYVAYSPYAPVENMKDLSDSEWEDWAQYFEAGAKSEPVLMRECIYTYVKANNHRKVKELLENYPDKQNMITGINNFISYLHTMGIATKMNSGDFDSASGFKKIKT